MHNLLYFLLLLPLSSEKVNFLRYDFKQIAFLRNFYTFQPNSELKINNCWPTIKNREFIRLCTNTTKIGFFNQNHNSFAFDAANKEHKYFIFDLFNCTSSLQLLKNINANNLFVYTVKFMLLVENKEWIESEIGDLQLWPNTELIVVVFDRKNGAEVWQVYKTGREAPLTWEKYGNWSLTQNLTNKLTKPTIQRRSNLKQVKLQIVIVLYENKSWNHLLDYREPGVDTFTKQDFPAMKCVFEHLNINPQIYATDNYGYISPENGEFSGLIHEIQSGRADVSGVSVYFTEDRFGAVDLIKMGNPLALRFIVKKPSTSFIKNIFFITFSTDVWIAGVVIMVISAAVVKIILGWEVMNGKKGLRQNRYTVSDVVLISLEAVCQQGTTTEPQSFAGRIIALILFGAFMFVYVSYSANIVVLLQSTTKINSLQELLESRIRVGGESTVYMKNYFESVNKGVLRELYVKKIYPNQYYPLDVGMRMVQEGNFAFHILLQSAYEYILNNFTSYEICGIQELPGYIEENRGYVAIQKKSPYKDIFKVAILKVDEYGLQRRTNLRVVHKPKCFSESATFKSIEIYDCEQVFWIWIYGICLAVGIFCGEKIYFYARQIHQARQRANQSNLVR